jgi:hypothetical protein
MPTCASSESENFCAEEVEAINTKNRKIIKGLISFFVGFPFLKNIFSGTF